MLQLYGKETTDADRPSAKTASDYDAALLEEDKGHRDILKAVKLRDVIHCAECVKPRCVFAPQKLSRDQVYITKIKQNEKCTALM